MAELKEGVVGGAMNLYFIYKFLRILTTPFASTDAFKLGIIDEKGKILIKKSRLKSIEQKEAYTMFDRLVWKLKRLMEKIPFGKTRLASYAAALWLIKEEKDFHGTDNELQESFLTFLETDWKTEALILKENYEGDMDKKTYSSLKEGIDIKKADMKDVIKDFQSSDAPQFKGKSDKKKKEMAIAAKLSKEEVEIDEAKSKLPPHLAKFFDKDGNLKKDAAARVAKGKEKINWIDVTPKGYGPKDEVYEIGTEEYKNHAKAVTPGQDAELGEAKRSRKDELKYQAALADFKKKGGKIKKDKPGPAFKSFFKGYKHKKGPIQAEEVEATRMPMEAPFKLVEKWEVGVVYHQDFGGGEISYFRADALLKNGRWKGMAVDEIGGKQKRPKNITADEKVQGWEMTPKNEIPKGLKEEIEEKKVPKIKFKLKQFKHMKPKKKKKEHGSYSRYSDTSKGFAFGKSKGTSFGVGYNHNELDGTEIKEAAVLDVKDVDKWEKEIEKGVDAGWISVQSSNLGGDKNVAILIKLTLEKEKDWPHNILQNASYGMLRIATDGTMEMFASDRRVKNMRKTKIKSAKDVVSKINTWIKQVGEEVNEASLGSMLGKKAKKLNKASSGYDLYHKDFSSAMQHAYDHAKKKGAVVDKKEIDDKVATGPKKPSKGKTNRYELKAGKRTVMIQVANLDNKRYELNMYIEGKEELSTFSKFITEGRGKQDPDYVPGATNRDKTGLLRKLIDAQRKHYTEQEIKSIARKYKQNVATAEGGKDFQDWDGEWIITLMNSIELTYDYNSNTTTIRKWKFDKKKAEIHLAKYGNEHETVRDMKAEGGGKIKVGGFEAAFELMFGRVGRGMFEEVDLDEAKEFWAVIDKAKGGEVMAISSDEKGAKSSVKMSNFSKHDYHFGKDPRTLKIVKVAGSYKKGEKMIGTKLSFKEEIEEDAPANSVAAGNVNLDPFAKKKRKNAKVQWEMFGGQKVFVVSPERFYDSRMGKARYVRYEKYVGNDKLGETIRQYGRNNPKNAIILKNSGNGAMLYLKYGRQ